MAAYISVPRDLTRVKSKILFGLTKRQIICFGTGALIGVPVYFFVRGSGNLSLAALTMIAVMLPFFFFGMYERNGQPPEVVARHWLKMQQRKREAEENKPDPDADYREDEEEIVLPDEPDAETDEDAERKVYQDSDGYEE